MGTAMGAGILAIPASGFGGDRLLRQRLLAQH